MVTDTVAAAALPVTLGEYTILLKLAQGGMATIFVARKTGVAGFERLVAIKYCHPHLSNDEEFVSMFLDEARLAARIHHPNVVPTLDVHCSDCLYLVMDYVEGGSFASLLRRTRESGVHLSLDIVLAIMIDVLNGLHAAHELRDGEGKFFNLVHRDVSPQNVLVGVDGVARLTDFGIASAASSTVTQAGRFEGKLAYMAPEQIQGHDLDRRTDIFAAGCVLWEALAGRPLFRHGEDAETMDAVLGRAVPPLSSLVPTIPAAFDEVVLKALEREPHKRYATAGDFADALERLPVRRARTREVAASVQAAFGSVIAERHEVLLHTSIRPDRSPGQVAKPMPPSDHVGGGDRAAPSDDSCEEITRRMDEATLRRLAKASRIGQAARAPVDELEHRRVRSILAAMMLLLAGSAIGLLLARSGHDSTGQAVHSSTSAPASESTK